MEIAVIPWRASGENMASKLSGGPNELLPNAGTSVPTCICNWRPWERSTGSKTAQGKARVSKNSFRGAVRPALRRLASVMRQQRDGLSLYRATL